METSDAASGDEVGTNATAEGSGRPERAPEARPASSEAAPGDSDPQGTAAREEISVAVDSAQSAAEPVIPGARGQPVSETAAAESTRDALLEVSARGHRLARLLDRMALRYATPGLAQATDAHVALDQAAAAAEDLGNCAHAAARAIEDEGANWR